MEIFAPGRFLIKFPYQILAIYDEQSPNASDAADCTPPAPRGPVVGRVRDSVVEIVSLENPPSECEQILLFYFSEDVVILSVFSLFFLLEGLIGIWKQYLLLCNILRQKKIKTLSTATVLFVVGFVIRKILCCNQFLPSIDIRKCFLRESLVEQTFFSNFCDATMHRVGTGSKNSFFPRSFPNFIFFIVYDDWKSGET